MIHGSKRQRPNGRWVEAGKLFVLVLDDWESSSVVRIFESEQDAERWRDGDPNEHIECIPLARYVE